MNTNNKPSAPKFARYRRVTGYLTGTVDRWGTSKQCELRDRVKHTNNCHCK